MKKNIANRSFSFLIATSISISLFTGCGIANDDEISTEQSENVSVSIIIDEIPVTITTETTINFLEETIVETTEAKTETAESSTESEQLTTTEEMTITTTETTTVTTDEEKTTYKSPQYIDNYKFTDEDMIDVNDDDAVLRIKDEYAIEFKQLYSTYMREVQGYQYLSEIDKRDVQQETKQKVKKELLEKNKKYQVLVERGII